MSFLGCQYFVAISLLLYGMDCHCISPLLGSEIPWRFSLSRHILFSRRPLLYSGHVPCCLIRYARFILVGMESLYSVNYTRVSIGGRSMRIHNELTTTSTTAPVERDPISASSMAARNCDVKGPSIHYPSKTIPLVDIPLPSLYPYIGSSVLEEPKFREEVTKFTLRWTGLFSGTFFPKMSSS
ncbi:unnamed protein product [Somion occarium]|uniref:Uncharacterized protein n=1 Tax=Somion occarium TaxID=3059160 RepID=A0ABP1DRD7_9APHY